MDMTAGRRGSLYDCFDGPLAGRFLSLAVKALLTLIRFRFALLTLGAAASDARLWRAPVSTTKRTLKPAGAKP